MAVDIKTFSFEKNEFHKLKDEWFGRNWPVVYVLENDREIYIGQTTNLYGRSKQHSDNPDRRRLKRMHVITDEEYNLSAALDVESKLIQYISAEEKFSLQNGNGGLLNHNYFDKERYLAKFEVVWQALQKMTLVKKDLVQLRNSDIFKFSPYKALTEDQLVVVSKIEQNILNEPSGLHIVAGKPGTGKTVLAVYLIKHMLSLKQMKDKKIAIVVPMASLRKTIRRVFKSVSGLSPNMVIGPSDVVKEKYDVLIVDEAHRLRQRKNITNYASHDNANRQMGFGNEGTELDWILKQSTHQVLFYDENQSVRPADIASARYKDLKAERYELVSQMRVAAGENYIRFIDDLFASKPVSDYTFKDYDFRMYDDVSKMVTDIRMRDSEHSLARVVAGFAWKWRSQKKPGVFDIEIGDTKLIWNTVAHDWVNSKNAVNEVGCIHTVQGYDLNYVGVIIGPELSYDEKTDSLVVKPEHYMDTNGWKGIQDPQELKRYIINIYKALLARGIRGTYVYVCDEKLRNHFNTLLGTNSSKSDVKANKPVLSPITVAMVQVPLVGSAPCGDPLLGETNIEEYISVDKAKIKPGFQYFILRAEGDSMDQAGINDGDFVLCRQQQKGDTGDRVVALLGDNVTIKEYGARENGVRKLLPKSSNPKHQPITPGEGDTVQGVVQEVLNLD